MVTDQEDVFYYITVMNENYEHPRSGGCRGGHSQRLVLVARVEIKIQEPRAAHGLGDDPARSHRRGRPARSGLESRDRYLERDQLHELRREGLAAERWNLLHPEGKPRTPYVTGRLEERAGPVVAATDYMKTFADQIRPFMPKDRVYRVLGTDGFGRSDSRSKLRHFFEVDRYFIAIAALKALADVGEVKPKVVAEAIKKYGINPENTIR